MSDQQGDQAPAASTGVDDAPEPLPIVEIEPNVMVDEFKGSQPGSTSDGYIQGVERR